MRPDWRASCVTLTVLATLAGSARAQSGTATEAPGTSVGESQTEPEPESRLTWVPAWPRFRAVGYALTAASVAGALGATFLIPYPEEPRWVGGIFVDTVARRYLRARQGGLRDAIRYASDLTLVASLLHTGLIDGIVIPGAEGSWNVAWQLTLMNAQALSLNILVATLLFKAAARARPTYAGCEADRTSDPLCDTGEFASFPSSHTSTAFTAAGLTCIHHANLPLYGGPPLDAAACAGSIVLATATGLFRVMGDRHHLSDVFLGAAFGFSLGYLYPWFLHYQYGARDWVRGATSAVQWGIVPGAERSPYGVSVIGQF